MLIPATPSLGEKGHTGCQFRNFHYNVVGKRVNGGGGRSLIEKRMWIHPI